tara:strand:+ start:60 stop:1262 length:1203 start_codon:yes stop_codon:yes gene_type:complete
MAAIIDGVKGAVTSQAAAAANRTIRAGLTKVAGNLLGINTSFDGPQLGAMGPRYRRNKYSPTSLAYPMDVEADGQGHYIFFHINEQDKGAVEKRAAVMRTMREHEKKIQAEFKFELAGLTTFAFGATRTVTRSLEEVRADYIRDHAIVGYTGDTSLTTQVIGGDNSRGDSSSIKLRYPSTTRSTTHIALYMPPSVQVSYGADYNDTEIGLLADIGAGFIQNFKEGTPWAKQGWKEQLDKAGSGMKKLAIGALDIFAPGAKAIAQIQTGRAITPKMELMFNGIGRREFSYEFNFIPKSSQEAKMVKDIVYQFKYHMSANYIEDSGFREMELPSTFDIEYQHLTKRNDSLNRISTCVLESADVAYGGDRFQAHAGGVPLQTKLSLKFKEMEIITKSRIEDGY